MCENERRGCIHKNLAKWFLYEYFPSELSYCLTDMTDLDIEENNSVSNHYMSGASSSLHKEKNQNDSLMKKIEYISKKKFLF